MLTQTEQKWVDSLKMAQEMVMDSAMKKHLSLLDITRSKPMVRKARFLARFMQDRVVCGGWFVTRIWAFRYAYLLYMRRGYTEAQSASVASQYVENLTLASSF